MSPARPTWCRLSYFYIVHESKTCTLTSSSLRLVSSSVSLPVVQHVLKPYRTETQCWIIQVDVCIDSMKGRRTPRSWHNNFNGIYCWNDLQYNLLPLQDAGRYTFCVRYFWEYRALSSSLFSLFSLLLSCWFVTLLSVDLVSLFWRLEGAWLWHVLYSLHYVFMVYVVAAVSLRLNGNSRSHSGSFPKGDALSESQDGGELNEESEVRTCRSQLQSSFAIETRVTWMADPLSIYILPISFVLSEQMRKLLKSLAYVFK